MKFTSECDNILFDIVLSNFGVIFRANNRIPGMLDARSFMVKYESVSNSELTVWAFMCSC